MTLTDEIDRMVAEVIVAHTAAYHPGRLCRGNAHGQCADVFGDPPTPPYTLDQARGLGIQGWNLRCNRCGSYGAAWVRGERPGWGDLALCPPHKQELAAEHARHAAALARLRQVNFEQPNR